MKLVIAVIKPFKLDEVKFDTSLKTTTFHEMQKLEKTLK